LVALAALLLWMLCYASKASKAAKALIKSAKIVFLPKKSFEKYYAKFQ